MCPFCVRLNISQVELSHREKFSMEVTHIFYVSISQNWIYPLRHDFFEAFKSIGHKLLTKASKENAITPRRYWLSLVLWCGKIFKIELTHRSSVLSISPKSRNTQFAGLGCCKEISLLPEDTYWFGDTLQLDKLEGQQREPKFVAKNLVFTRVRSWNRIKLYHQIKLMIYTYMYCKMFHWHFKR